MKIYNNFADWADKYSHQILRMWKYKKVWTPWEQENCDELVSEYVQDTCDYIVIREIVTFPNGEIMIGYEPNEGEEVTDEFNAIYYVMLKDVELAWYEGDQDNE